MPTSAPIAVGPGRAETEAPDRGRAAREIGVTYPIQPGKVQAPALRDETLARTRLLDWLEAKVHSRVIFVIADAGYGKTTLLADFSRRTRVRTIWYRLDEDDRDWVGFLSHLVAAGREHDPGFAPRTTAMLGSLESAGPTRDDAVAMFLKELPTIVADGSAALVFDDFHLADEVADVRLIAREILARAPERLSIIFASRRQPPVPVSKLRAIGELAELGIADLRFSDAELEQLFRETYHRPLDPDVLTELARRTEGWAASLTLVQAALRERSPAETRTFIRGLSGARDELHDYLAEEVVGDLPLIHQQFLMRTSVLQVVTPELAQVATGLEAVEVQSLMLESERLGLLGRRPNRRSTAQRYHPLVREFLEERLRRAIGPSGVEDLHVTVARWAESTDWRTAAHHFASARHWRDLRRVIDSSLETIVASGSSSAALELVELMPAVSRWPARLVLESRVANASGDYARGGALAGRAANLAPDNDVAIGTLVAARILEGRYGEASLLLDDLSRTARTPLMHKVARATRLLVASSVDGDLSECAEVCEALAEECQAIGLHHYEGVSWLNAALTHSALGRLDRAQACSRWAVAALGASSSGAELAAANSVDASLAAINHSIEEARRRFEVALAEVPGAARVELLSEYAEAEIRFGDVRRAEQLLAGRRADELNSSSVLVELLNGLIRIRNWDGEGALAKLESLERGRPSAIPGHEARVLASIAVAAEVAADPRARSASEVAIQLADSQGARVAEAIARLALGHATGSMEQAIQEIPTSLSFVLSEVAELIASDIDELERDAIDRIAREAQRVPERWRPALRHEVDTQTKAALPAARLLDVVGDKSDVVRLKRMAKRAKRNGSDRLLGAGLARRLAHRVQIEDLGRVTVILATETVPGSEIRRKVLGLLCFLLSRPRWAATREEVMEAMWPEFEPSAAINSLNQAVYYLRRVFESEYSEETTAGYLHQDSDLIWLDRELIRAASATCAELVADYDRTGEPEYAAALAEKYTGKFALDFAYEDWSADFRDWLHVAYLHVVETQVKADADAGRFDRGVSIARHALALEPRNEELELSLLKLLRGAGAHSAAAEQYSRYAHVLRTDLGVEPPSPDAV